MTPRAKGRTLPSGRARKIGRGVVPRIRTSLRYTGLRRGTSADLPPKRAFWDQFVRLLPSRCVYIVSTCEHAFFLTRGDGDESTATRPRRAARRRWFGRFGG